MWNLKTIKAPKGQLELKISYQLKEMIQFTFATNSFEFISAFHERLSSLKRTNNFSADLMYKAKGIDLTHVEIWKLTATGYLKHKMFELEYIKSSN